MSEHPLIQSAGEAVEIAKGEREPARVYTTYVVEEQLREAIRAVRRENELLRDFIIETHGSWILKYILERDDG